MRSYSKTFFYKDYYRVSGGFYSSYWLGKLTNSLIISGHKKRMEREMHKVYVYLKFLYNVNPSGLILEQLELVKPLFNIQHVIQKGQRREFPSVLSRNKQLRLVTFWLKVLIKNRKENFVFQRVYSEVVSLKESKRHIFHKRREDLFRAAVERRFNIRFTY